MIDKTLLARVARLKAWCRLTETHREFLETQPTNYKGSAFFCCKHGYKIKKDGEK